MKGTRYRANLSTTGLKPGDYVLRVSFASARLIGRVEIALVLR